MENIFKDDMRYDRQELEELFAEGPVFLGVVEFYSRFVKELNFSLDGVHLLFKRPCPETGLRDTTRRQSLEHGPSSFKAKINNEALFDITGKPTSHEEIYKLVEEDCTYYLLRPARFKDPEQFLVRGNKYEKKKLTNFEEI